MSYEDYVMMINPLIYNPFLDWIIHFQRELPLSDCSFWLEIVELRGAGGEPGEVVLLNHIPTLWIENWEFDVEDTGINAAGPVAGPSSSFQSSSLPPQV